MAHNQTIDIPYISPRDYECEHCIQSFVTFDEYADHLIYDHPLVRMNGEATQVNWGRAEGFAVFVASAALVVYCFVQVWRWLL